MKIFNDYNKYLSVSLKVYVFVLIIIFIMKMVGLNYFGLSVDNLTLIKISDFIVKTHLSDVIIAITIYIQFYFYLCLVCKKEKLYLQAFVGTFLNLFIQAILFYFYKLDWIYYLYNFGIMLIVPMFVNKSISVKQQIKYLIIISIYQLICLTIRNVGVNNNYGNFLVDTLLNIDQLLLLAITYNLTFMKGGEIICLELEVGYFLQKLTNLKLLPKKLLKNWHSLKELSKVERITCIIYFILVLLWNIFTFAVVLLVGFINDTFVECIFILTSFWLSKGKFGKAFHLKSMVQCFIVSNLTYYILNRVTTPIGISILVPILLGVGLSYITSKFVKKKYKPLYRGMSEELFEETILQVADKDSCKYRICYDFYIKGKSDLSISMKYNYSVAGIRKIKDRINNKIKEL